MGFMDYISDLYESLSIRTAEAEEQQQDESDSNEEGGDDKGGEEGGAKSDEGESGDSEGGDSEEGADDGGGEEEGGDDEEEEEEEEEEPEDIKPKLEAECMKTSACAPLKHHYDECAERVQHQESEQGKAQEDCVEEYFHMMHCAAQCAAPKLFKQLR